MVRADKQAQERRVKMTETRAAIERIIADTDLTAIEGLLVLTEISQSILKYETRNG